MKLIPTLIALACVLFAALTIEQVRVNNLRSERAVPVGVPQTYEAEPVEVTLVDISIDDTPQPIIAVRSDLFDAIRVEESRGWNGIWDDPSGIGAAGEIGPYQITRAYHLDAMLQLVKEGIATDVDAIPYWFMWDEHYAELIMRAYWQRYGAETDEQKARMHNGGPFGMDNPATLDYWNRIQERLLP